MTKTLTIPLNTLLSLAPIAYQEEARVMKGINPKIYHISDINFQNNETIIKML